MREALSLLDGAARAKLRNAQVGDLDPAEEVGPGADHASTTTAAPNRLLAAEDAHQRRKHPNLVLVFYGLGITAAAALTLASSDPASRIPMVGASGAISGVLAAYVLLFPRARVTVIVPLGIIFYPFALSAFWVVSFWFVLQLVSASFSDPHQPGVAWWAHVGGFVAGLLLTPVLKSRAFPMFGRPRRGPWSR